MNSLKKILIVEDESSLRQALREKLGHEGYSVLEASDGVEGLACALKDKPDLIILDLEMPNMNGTTMLSLLRKDEQGKGIKVIVLTNVTDLNEVATVIEDNGTVYLVKNNTNLDELAKHIKEMSQA